MSNYSIENYEECKELYLKGESLTKISERFSINRKKLSHLLKEDGVNIVQNNQKYKYDESFFDKIDTEQKAYWLGFIYADGNVVDFGRHEISIAIAAKDKEHLEKFRDLISPKKPLSIYNSKIGDKVYPSVKFAIYNKNLVESIKGLGCYPNKSLTLLFPCEDIVPKHLKNHFIRGYFDGDGHISITYPNTNGYPAPNFSILGTASFLESIQNTFEIIGVSKVKTYKKKGQQSYAYAKGGRLQVLKIYEYLYQNATVFLERKKNRFEQLKREM